MTTKLSRAYFAMGALALASAGSPLLSGCVADRPARNGVFNENVYIRKSFLVRDAEVGEDGQPKADPGWILKATVTQTSTPNPLAGLDFWPGVENGGSLVRFVITNDKLQMVNQKEIGDSAEIKAQNTRTPEVVNSWNASSVDIKYRVNLDGEKTNFLEENQESDWQTRQWVKVSFAKNELSDFAPFGSGFTYILERCVDPAHTSASLVPGSVHIDEEHDYMEWSVGLTMPVQFDQDACVQAYGENGQTFQKLGRNTVSMTLKYSMVRATPADKITYKPLELAEKDPIRRKYGAIRGTTISRDQDTGLLAARQLVWRYDPEKPIVWYFAPGYPERYKKIFLNPGGIVDQTNKILEDAGVKARLSVKNFDEDMPEDYSDEAKKRGREVGDVRYNFIRWQSDLDVGAPFIGVAQFVPDPRTGETLSASINIADSEVKEYVVQRVDAYLKTVGASLDVNSPGEWPDGPAGCKDGDTMPLVETEVAKNHNGKSSLYNKMQDYLNKPASKYGNLGPADFTAQQDEEFFKVYYQTIPYQVYADPDTNPFVTPEGGAGVFGPQAQFKALEAEAKFHKAAKAIDRGQAPFAEGTGPTMVKSAAEFLNNFRQSTLDHRDYEYKQQFRNNRRAQYDTTDIISLQQVMARAARHCRDGKWETKQQWIDTLMDSYHSLVVWHEFGHILGLEHNFMASVDKPNYPHYKDKAGRDHVGLYASSVMEYNVTPDRIFWGNETGGPGWAPYDRGAIGWIYANNTTTKQPVPAGKVATGISGQISNGVPWKDPYGFKADGTERPYLFCTHEHMKYTPLCRTFDFGSTPSEIIANDLDNYEWQYRWRNFRQYRKYWNNGQYASTPAKNVTEMRRFLSMWGYDWGESGLIDMWRRIGIKPPAGTPSTVFYYDQLVDKFTKEMSSANTMVAAFHKAVIQQASGERPYRTVYDDYYGDVTQQGIILDKLFAMQGWVGLWPTDNYDPDQAGGYVASYSSLGDETYRSAAEDAVTSMIGEQYYDAYPYFKPLAVVQFQQDTHSANFGGRIEARDWAGGIIFTRQKDLQDYFRALAVKHGKLGCTSLETCTYDPLRPRADAAEQQQSDQLNEFVGPDGRRWAWAYIQDRNTWVVVDRDRNTATYKMVNDYALEILKQDVDSDTGYSYQLPLKYFLDSFTYYN